MSDGAAERQEPAPPPTRSQRGEGDADDSRPASASSPVSERPASVRETMPRSLRYESGPARRPTSRRRPPPPRGDLPPPARALTDGPVAEIPSRQVEVENELWTVLLTGSATVGRGNGRGARLLSVGLEAPGDRPNPEGTHYLVAQTLDDVDEDVLRGLVAQAIHDPDAAPGSSRSARGPRGRGRFRRRNR